MFVGIRPSIYKSIRINIYNNVVKHNNTSIYTSAINQSAINRNYDFNTLKNAKFSDKIINCTKLMRCHSPIPIVIIVTPVMWSASLAMPAVVTADQLKNFALYWLGGFFARSAGCCINDLADVKFDRCVERTKIRPLASNSITHTDAFMTLAFNASAALSILLQFDDRTISLGFLSAVMASIYPFTKRFTNYPQLFLGCSFAVGTLMGWTSMTSASCLSIPPLCIYMTTSLWSVIYDTIYAHQDKEYDKLLNLKSLSLHWKDTRKNSFIVLHIMSSLMTICGYYSGLNYIYYTSLLASHLWMIRELRMVNLDDPANCLRFFKRNVVYGGLILFGLIFGRDHILNLSDENSVVNVSV